MKVIAINGSPKSNGNTNRALEIMGNVFNSEGIDFEIIHIGNKPISGCLGCGACKTNKDKRCVIASDSVVNDSILKMESADALIFGSPVYFSNIAGSMKCFMDRVFVVAGANGGLFRHKAGASLAVARRTGGSFTYSALNFYLGISEMITVGSNYWNVVHGNTPGEMIEDIEGVQLVEQLAKNISWSVKATICSKENGINAPEQADKIKFNYIR